MLKPGVSVFLRLIHNHVLRKYSSINKQKKHGTVSQFSFQHLGRNVTFACYGSPTSVLMASMLNKTGHSSASFIQNYSLLKLNSERLPPNYSETTER